MMLKIESLKKVFYSEEEDDYSHKADVVSKEESEICCSKMETDIEFELGEFHTLGYNNHVGKLIFEGHTIDYCPYCGEKIEIEYDTTYQQQFEREYAEKERKYKEYLASLPPKPKKVIKKMKKDALTDYQKVFDKYTLS